MGGRGIRPPVQEQVGLVLDVGERAGRQVLLDDSLDERPVGERRGIVYGSAELPGQIDGDGLSLQRGVVQAEDESALGFGKEFDSLVDGCFRRTRLAANAAPGAALRVEDGLEIDRALGAGVLDPAQMVAVCLDLNVIAEATASGADQRPRDQGNTSVSTPFDPQSWGKRIRRRGASPSARPNRRRRESEARNTHDVQSSA